VGRVALSVYRLAMGWTIWGLNPGGSEIFRTCQDRPWGPAPPPCIMGTGSFPGVESGRGVTLTLHPLLLPRSENSRAIPLLSLRAFVASKKGETYLPKTGSFLLETTTIQLFAVASHKLINVNTLTVHDGCKVN
jgi:hypothetical protein